MAHYSLSSYVEEQENSFQNSGSNDQIYGLFFKVSLPKSALGCDCVYEITNENLSKYQSTFELSSPCASENCFQSSFGYQGEQLVNLIESETRPQNSMLYVNTKFNDDEEEEEFSILGNDWDGNLDLTSTSSLSSSPLSSSPYFESINFIQNPELSSPFEESPPPLNPFLLLHLPSTVSSPTPQSDGINEVGYEYFDSQTIYSFPDSLELKSQTSDALVTFKVEQEKLNLTSLFTEPQTMKINKRRRIIYPKIRECSNCGIDNTPLWRQTLDKKIVCNACGLYLKQHNKPRPRKCRNESEAPSCSHCKMKKTPAWRRDKNGHLLCNACGLYVKLHNSQRPLTEPISQLPQSFV